MAQEYGKINRIIVADSDQQVRMDMGRILTRLANVVDRFSDGDDALSYAENNPTDLIVISMGCWNSIEEAIKAIKKATYLDYDRLVISANKMMPRHFNQLRKMGINNLFGNPMDPVYLFRIVHDLYGIVARRFLRINHQSPVFWGPEGQVEIIGNTMDISRGGMRLLTEKKMNIGDSIFWGIQLAPDNNIQVRGEILKIDAVTYKPQIAYGVAFIEIPTITALVLDEAIDSFVAAGADVADISFTEEIK